MTAITGRSTVEVLALVATGLGALGVIFHYIRKMVRAVTNAVQAVTDFGHRLEKVVLNVESQLYPNGGFNLRDAVDRHGQTLSRQEIMLGDIQRQLGMNADRGAA